MPRFTDTIAALATPAGTSALAVLRVSGSDTAALAKSLLGAPPHPRRVQRADYHDRSGTLVDDVLCVYFQAPHSYTGEDVLEISSHGNPLIAQRILQDLCARGCRPAEPGEFTQRAFLNGRMDLSQAEAVADLIHARSERALAAANQQLRGALGRHVNRIAEKLIRALARVEAYIDFPDEDLPAEDQSAVLSDLAEAQSETNRLLATQRYGDLLRDGIKTVIVGAPNVGKSSLLNGLLGHERALVSPEPGTTRDYIEECLVLGPHCIRLIDTAGLNSSPGALESLGIQKSHERIADADLILAVIDLSDQPSTLPTQLATVLRPETTIVAANKADITGIKCGQLADYQGLKTIGCSAMTGAGLDLLAHEIAGWADQWRPDYDDEVIGINVRHADALASARDALEAAISKLRHTPAMELLASDLRSALASLGEIAGKIDNERVLDELFRTFCIGK